MDGCRRDLGKQRLEDEIVIGVDELDLDLVAALPLECLGSVHAAEATADHEDFLLIHGQQVFLRKPYLRQCGTGSSSGIVPLSLYWLVRARRFHSWWRLCHLVGHRTSVGQVLHALKLIFYEICKLTSGAASPGLCLCFSY